MQHFSGAVALFTVAGVATERGFMDPLRDKLSSGLGSRGCGVVSEALYPYGDWTRRLTVQLAVFLRDFMDFRERFRDSSGARTAREGIFRAAEAGHRLLLVGHSGGGVTAVQLAGQLIRAGYGKPLVIQIGSPKCPISPVMKAHVLYLYAAGKAGRCTDPVCRLGSWGGWVREAGTPPRWKRKAYAPDEVIGVPIVGGHADYFRGSNMDLTLQPIWDWLASRCTPG